MAALRCILGLGPKRTQPWKYETDQVYPMHSSDDTKLYRKLMLNWTLRFDDVLDFDLLQDSLCCLFEHGNWKKLGGRIRLNPDGNLVLSVPKEFTPERPAVRFSHQVFDMAINEHSLASQLPKATGDHMSKHLGPLKFRPFGARPDAPKSLEDLLYCDEPQLAVHVTTFKDATLIGILWPHTMTGAIGLSALMNAWSLSLADRLNEVPDLQGVWDDPLGQAESMAESSTEPYVLAPKQLQGFKLLKAGFNFALNTKFRPKRELRMVYLPARFISQLRLRAEGELRESCKEIPFISDGDLICAWATQLVAKERGKDRAILSLNTFDVQSRLTLVFKSEPAYVQNTAFGVISLFSPHEAIEGGFGQAAYKYRKDIGEQTTEAQILAQLRCAKEAERTGRPAIFGDPKAMFLVITNWIKANFYEIIDFSPAVVENDASSNQSSNKKKTPPGKLVYHHSEAITTNPTAGNVCVILGKDLSGNYWVATSMSPDDENTIYSVQS